MPRVKDAFDWSLTWSPENDVTDVPEFFKKWLGNLHENTRYYAVLERHDETSKWHFHAGFSTRKSYNSDYKWWKKPLELEGFKEPALDIHYHNNIFGLVGGYCAKAAKGDRIYVGSQGFTDEQLTWGKEQYEKGLRRQRVKTALDELRIINKDKWDAAIGYQQAELGINSKEEAIASLVEDGWAFSQSIKGTEAMYKHMYLDRQRIRTSVPESA